MRIGPLRHRVTLQQRATGVDPYGQPVDTWQDVATVWAQVEDLRGREFLEAKQAPGSEVTTRIRMRYRDGVTPDMRAVHKDRVLQVVAVLDPDGRATRLELMCAEVQ